MRKAISLMLLTTTIWSLTACGGNVGNTSSEKKTETPSVVQEAASEQRNSQDASRQRQENLMWICGVIWCRFRDVSKRRACFQPYLRRGRHTVKMGDRRRRRGGNFNDCR